MAKKKAPKQKDIGQLSKKEKNELLKDISLHCTNCREDYDPEDIKVQLGGDDRYFIFCGTCDLFMKMLDWSKPSKIPAEVAPAAVNDAELKAIKEELFLLKAENKLLKKQAVAGAK